MCMSVDEASLPSSPTAQALVSLSNLARAVQRQDITAEGEKRISKLAATTAAAALCQLGQGGGGAQFFKLAATDPHHHTRGEVAPGIRPPPETLGAKQASAGGVSLPSFSRFSSLLARDSALPTKDNMPTKGSNASAAPRDGDDGGISSSTSTESSPGRTAMVRYQATSGRGRLASNSASTNGKSTASSKSIPRTSSASSKRKRCNERDCGKFAVKGGLCKAHGGFIRCWVEGCGKHAVKYGMCKRHRSTMLRSCEVDSCSRYAKVDGKCLLHASALNSSFAGSSNHRSSYQQSSSGMRNNSTAAG